MFLLCVVFAQVNLGQDSREKKDEKTKVCVCVCVCVYACARAHECRNRERVEEGASSLGRAKQVGMSILRLCWHGSQLFVLNSSQMQSRRKELG